MNSMLFVPRRSLRMVLLVDLVTPSIILELYISITVRNTGKSHISVTIYSPLEECFYIKVFTSYILNITNNINHLYFTPYSIHLKTYNYNEFIHTSNNYSHVSFGFTKSLVYKSIVTLINMQVASITIIIM